MKGSKKVIELLQIALTNKLAAINQTFLHARIFQDWGFSELGEYVYKISIKRMKQGDELIKRILFLEALPNVQRMGKLMIGENSKEILSSDLNMELNHITQLKETIKMCETEKDFVTRELLLEFLHNEEETVDWLETQLNLMDKVGMNNYLQSQMSMDEGN